MSLPYKELTPIEGDMATSHTPESETMPDFMNGKFEELKANDVYLDNQINVLNNASYGSTLKTLTDINLDDFITDGEYWVNGENCANVPRTNWYGMLKVKVLDNMNAWQEYFHHAQSLGKWYRVRNAGTWGQWEQIPTVSQLQSLQTQLNAICEMMMETNL